MQARRGRRQRRTCRAWLAAAHLVCTAPASKAPVTTAASSTVHVQLNEVNITQFWKQGYLWITGFASQAEVDDMRAEISAMIEAWELPSAATFRASLSLRNDADDGVADHSFFLDSAAKASFFVEASAVDANAGVLRPGVSKRQAVRKVAHGLHLSPGPFQEFSTSMKVSATAIALGLQQPAVVQSLYRLAPPLAAGVDRHQDSTMLYTEPPTCLGLWLALEDTDETNGCLRVREGSHYEAIRERLVRRPGKDGAGVQLQWEKNLNVSHVPAPEGAFRPLMASKGDLIVMHGSLEHVSFAGTSPHRSRESFQLHLVDAEAKWSHENWLQYPPDVPFTLLAPKEHPPSTEL